MIQNGVFQDDVKWVLKMPAKWGVVSLEKKSSDVVLRIEHGDSLAEFDDHCDVVRDIG